jgi:hypothetical protein
VRQGSDEHERHTATWTDSHDVSKIVKNLQLQQNNKSVLTKSLVFSTVEKTNSQFFRFFFTLGSNTRTLMCFIYPAFASPQSLIAQIPVIVEKLFLTCGSKKFQLDPRRDHLHTCTTHSGATKTHDWMVDQIAGNLINHYRKRLIKLRCHWCLSRKYRADYNMNPGGYIVILSDFYSYSLIGKLTTFLQFQEFNWRKQIVECSTTVAGRPSYLNHTLTHHTRKLLVY